MGRKTDYVDSLDRRIFLPEPARRVVSLVPSITELLFAYGLDREIVGVTNFCIHPKEKVFTRVKVGGTKRLRCKAVVELRPDLVIACAEENEQEQVLGLMEAGLKVYVIFPRSLSGALEMMRELAEVVGLVEQSHGVIHAAEHAYHRHLDQPLAKPPRVLCLIWRNPWMSFNQDTYVSSMIRTAGGIKPIRCGNVLSHSFPAANDSAC